MSEADEYGPGGSYEMGEDMARDEYDDTVQFVGPCTCEHEPEEHTWGCCGVGECNCDAGWEE